MQKIMFNDKYGLTKAVLEGKKTQTRRLALHSKEDVKVLDGLKIKPEDKNISQYVIDKYSRFKVGETIAVAQSYYNVLDYYRSLGNFNERTPAEKELIFHNEMRIMESTGNDSAMMGDENKMFVRADLMPFQIRITNIRLERIQDISNDDCLKEGIKKSWWMGASGKPLYGFGNDDRYTSPREAYAALIDKVSGKGTWERNPWVFVYDFELVK